MKTSDFYFGLRPKQLRRVKMKGYGLNGVEIADIEGVTSKAIYDSINRSEKTILKNIAKQKRLDAQDDKYMKIKDIRTRIWLMREDGMRYQKIMYLTNFSESFIYKAWTNINKQARDGTFIYGGIKGVSTRRNRMKKDGLSIKRIAFLENVSDKAIYLSLSKDKKYKESLEI